MSQSKTTEPLKTSIAELTKSTTPGATNNTNPPDGTHDHVQFVRLSPHAAIPCRAYGESAAFDLSACLVSENGRYRTATIGPGVVQLIGTGIALRPPRGHCVLVCSRSGMATQGVFVANAPGVVDPDYTGEIKVILINGGLSPQYIRHGDRIGQVLIVPFTAPPLLEVLAFPETERGDRGFGSTGA
jgi:dUTP pyrophosphatase